MPKQPENPAGMADLASASQESEEVKAKEYDMTGGRAPEDAIDTVLDEGVPVGHPAGQIRGDQTEGHRGGSRRQTQNRGRS